jgi:urea transport system substrate-binding protein
MWVKAVEKAKSTDPDKVIDALPGIEAKNLTGGVLEDAAEPPHHQAGAHRRDQGRRPVRRGLEDPGLVAGDAWSKELDGSKDLIGDWVGKKCGNFNTKTNKCGGQGREGAPLDGHASA